MKIQAVLTAILLATSIVMLGILDNAIAQPGRTPSTETIPTIINTSPGVVYQCASPFVFPASISTGSSGFIRVSCPSPALGRLLLGTNSPITLTPSLVLATGYSNAAIVLYNTIGNPCDFRFRPLMVGNVSVASGAFLNRSITFASPPSTGQLLTGNYDYCLQYTNAPLAGLNSFTITWT